MSTKTWLTAVLVLVVACKKDEARREEECPRGEGPEPAVVTTPEPVAAEPTPEPVAAAPDAAAKPCNPAIEDCAPPPGPAAPVNPDAPPPGPVKIAAGCFQMGSDDDRVLGSATPVHQVCLDAFRIDNYEVTNEDYGKCVASKKCAPAREYNGFTEPRQPVIGVDWDQANAYCQAMRKRLPTEAEWEYAALGAEARAYPWGSDFDCAAANVGSRGGSGECTAVNPGKTAPVGSYAKDVSPSGVYDMGGNVSEWVADFYDPDFYASSAKKNPVATKEGANMKSPVRVVRGGSYAGDATFTLSAGRSYQRPVVAQTEIGFRCAK